MNKDEYAVYEKTFAHGMNGLTHPSSGVCVGCYLCCSIYGYDEDTEKFNCNAEPGFSWLSCEVCGSTEGGNRYPIHAFDPTKNRILHMEACNDCVYYLEYGRLDDQTMDGIEEL